MGLHVFAATSAHATLIGFPSCTGANDCLIVDPTDPASPYFSDADNDGRNEITANPNLQGETDDGSSDSVQATIGPDS